MNTDPAGVISCFFDKPFFVHFGELLLCREPDMELVPQDFLQLRGHAWRFCSATLTDMGITKMQSSRWQAEARDKAGTRFKVSGKSSLAAGWCHNSGMLIARRLLMVEVVWLQDGWKPVITRVTNLLPPCPS